MFHEQFRRVALRHPERPALVCEGRALSYRALDERSDAEARALAAQGVGPGDIVPIDQPVDEAWFVRCLAILKCGAAYAPMSDALPPARREFLLADISAKAAPGAMLVYYTSGSTGEPKGAVLSHEGVLALCAMCEDLFALPDAPRSAVQANVGFDSFLLSTMPILYRGGTLYLMDEAERTSIVGIHKFLMKHRIHITFFTTQLAVEYMRLFDNPRLCILLTGGEALRSYTPRDYQVYNLYGPTECTVFVTTHLLRPGDEGDIPIGPPVGENRVFLIDGELCVAGPQLALGYLNRPEETAQRFAANPHYDPETDPPCYARMYRTGDLAEWDGAGELRYRGRRDAQLKISGYRIEPGEIEAALAKYEGIAAACVVAKPQPGGDHALTAFCVPTGGGVTPDALRAFLSERLPAYMIPKTFTMLDHLPVDPRTGKVDKKQL